MEHRRIVIKLGTNTLCDPDGRPDHALMAALAGEMHDLKQVGHQFMIVSSGAIGIGRSALKLQDDPDDVPTRQACSAVGQHRLMDAWDEALGKRRMRAAQALVAVETFQDRRAYLHLKDCLELLLKLGAVPIFNENDVLATDEIGTTFGDNDRLGALIAAKTDADLYIILSDVPGLYDKPPHVRGAKLVPRVKHIDDAMVAAAGKKSKGAGGMASKLESARYLAEAGIPTVIAYGREPGILHALVAPEEDADPPGTWFDAFGRRDGMEKWIEATRAHGRIHIDEGAAKALRDGYHLLPAGVTGVEGEWSVESVVDVVHDGTSVARAVSHYSSRDLERCKGLQSDDAKAALGIEGTANITRKGRIVLH